MGDDTVLVYCNAVRAFGGATDVTLDCGFRYGNDEPTMAVRLVMSWEHAKMLLPVLEQLINNYETNVGEIPSPESELKQENA